MTVNLSLDGLKWVCAVNGSLIRREAETYHIVETEWGTWKRMYPETKVVSTNTNHPRNYQRYPYGSYREKEGLLFRVSLSIEDDRIHQKKGIWCDCQ